MSIKDHDQTNRGGHADNPGARRGRTRGKRSGRTRTKLITVSVALVACGVVAVGVSQDPDVTSASTASSKAPAARSTTPTPRATSTHSTATPTPTPTPTATTPPVAKAAAPATTAQTQAQAQAQVQAATTTNAATTTSSTAMPTGNVTTNGRTWKQVYAEGFSTNASLGNVLRTYPRLGAYSGYNDTSGRGYYAPNKVLSVSNGNLDFWLHSENGQPLVATVLPDNYAPHTTGRVSIRYKTTATPGYKFVGMLWPYSDNWNQGEIDWPEGDLASTVRPASAYPWSMQNGQMAFDKSVEQHTQSTQSSGYHTATTEWDHGIVRFYWNGSLVSSTRAAVPTDPMRVTLQAETAVTGSVPLSASGHVDIDWVSIWN